MLARIGLSSNAVWWIAVLSAGMFGLALLAVPVLVTRIPTDYFAHPQRSDAKYPRRYLWFRWIWLIVKNVIGLALLVLGALMLVLPGQGLLTILLGLTLLDFPGKFKMQRWIVSRKSVFESINWIREKRGKPPLTLS